jgi:hypothetical protein
VFLAGLGRRFVVIVLVVGLGLRDGFKVGRKEAGFDPFRKNVRMLFGQEEGPGGGEAFRSRGAVGTATVFPVGADLFERRHGGGLPPIAA